MSAHGTRSSYCYPALQHLDAIERHNEEQTQNQFTSKFQNQLGRHPGARAKYGIYITDLANKTAKHEQKLLNHDEQIYPLQWKEHYGTFLKSFHCTVKDHKARHDDGVRSRVKSLSVHYHEADIISLRYDHEWSDFDGAIGESLQYNSNLQQKGKLSQNKTMWQPLGDFSQSVFKRLLKMIRRVDMNPAILVIIASLLFRPVEAMPQGVLDRPPDHSNDTRWILRAASHLVPGIAVVGMVRQGNILRRIQDGGSAFKSWLSRMCETVFGLLTLLHCVAWVVIVGLIDQGRSDLLKW